MGTGVWVTSGTQRHTAAHRVKVEGVGVTSEGDIEREPGDFVRVVEGVMVGDGEGHDGVYDVGEGVKVGVAVGVQVRFEGVTERVRVKDGDAVVVPAHTGGHSAGDQRDGGRGHATPAPVLCLPPMAVPLPPSPAPPQLRSPLLPPVNLITDDKKASQNLVH